MSLSHAREQSCGICNKLRGSDGVVVFEDELWHVRAADEPSGVPGWVMLITQRHVAGPAQFDDREASTFGMTLRHVQRVLLEVTGALRIYTAAMGESSPHFHAHMVPRYAQMPKEAKAWGVFDLQRAAAAREIPIDVARNERVLNEFRSALNAAPPPRR